MNIKNLKVIVIAALIGFFVAGCSKSAPKQTSSSQPKVTDLGVVELSNHNSQTNDLGDGKDCIVTFDATPYKTIDIHLVIETKDAEGNVKQIAMPRIGAIPGNKVSASVGNIGVTFTPHLKTN
jgi:hypothetical protein